MARVRCPNCGLFHDIDKPKKNNDATFESRTKRPYRSEAMAPPLPQPGSTYRETPSLPTVDSHVKIPFDQAIISGFFAAPIGGVVGYGIAMLINTLPDGPEFTSWGVVSMACCGAILTGFSVAGMVWSRRLGFYDSLLWTVEEIAGIDLNGDNEVGEPLANRLEVEITENGIPRQIEEFDTDLDRFRVLARLVITNGKSFSEETASEAGYARKEWVKIRDRFIKREYAAWNNSRSPKQGVSLRKQGVAILKRALPPTLTGPGISKNA